jgi:hypothetical protein
LPDFVDWEKHKPKEGLKPDVVARAYILSTLEAEAEES